jgi:hypothetical protein
MLIPWSAIGWGVAFAAIAAVACWYRRRWAEVWCGLFLISTGWAYTAAVRAAMPPNYYPIGEDLVGWLVMAVGGCLAVVWPAGEWLYGRASSGRRASTDEAADYADDLGRGRGKTGPHAEPGVTPDRPR